MLKANTWALTATLAGLTALGPLSTDMYLPALPEILNDLGTTNPVLQLTLSAFLVGFAAGQIVYGPLADRHGRKPVLIGGLALYSIASLACTIATSVELLIVARTVQALGASAPIVLARAVVRDLYEGPRAGNELARMGSIMGLVPAVAPFFGGLIAAISGWRPIFFVMLAFGIILLLIVGWRLPETLKHRTKEPFSLIAIFRAFASLLTHGGFRVHLAVVTLTYSGLFAFISGSSFVLQDLYGLSPTVYGIAFGACAGAYVLGTIGGQRIAARGSGAVITAGTLLLAAGGTVMLACVLTGLESALSVVLPMMLYMVGVGFALPQTQAAALMPFPDRAGTASSLVGVTQMSIAALVGIGVGASIGSSAVPLGAVIAANGIAAFLIYRFSRHVREASA